MSYLVWFQNQGHRWEKIWTEEQYEECLKGIYGMDLIAGFTENGVPYGTFMDENDVGDELISQDISFDSNDKVPF